MLNLMLAKVYRRAAEHVAMGWCQHEMYKGDAVCPIGALWRASQEVLGRAMIHEEWEPLYAVLDTLGVHRLPQPAHGIYGTAAVALGVIPAWNDAPGRTADEVEAVLCEAAGRCEG